MSQEGIARTDGDLMQGDGPDALITRGFLRGAGISEEMVRRRPVIGIANTWSELNPCNGDLRELAEHVKTGVIEAGGLPLEFPTISLAEAFIRPSSMYLRNLLAMDTEEMISASPIDGVVLLGGCDKTLPAQLMGAASAGKPAIALAAGPRPVSQWRGEPMTVEELWPLIDERRSGRMDDAEWNQLEACLSCGAGTCNVMGTAVSMAVVAEVMGMSLPGSALLAAGTSERDDAARSTGALAVRLVQQGLVPSQLMTPGALRNAFAVMCAVGGSTNTLLHLQAIAGRLSGSIEVDDLRAISARTPLIADVKPSGSGMLADLRADGGVAAVVERLGDLFELDALAADGRTWREVVAESPAPGSSVLRTREEPAGAMGALSILSGTLAPGGALLKRSAATESLCRHRGRAVVFEGVADLHARIDDPQLPIDEDTVLVLRGAGPIGGPGMPEVGHLPIPRRLLARGVTDMVRLSDARMSGTARGTAILHVTPESAAGGPLSLVRDGDWIELDADALTLDLMVDRDELASRASSGPSLPKVTRGFELLHRRHVTQADRGCDFDFLRADHDAG